MGIAKEKAFPRGGLPAKKDAKNSAKSNLLPDLFSTRPASTTKSKKAKAKKKKSATAQGEAYEVNSAEPLTYDRLSEGLVILGRISEVRDLELKVSLPGRLVVTIPITKISSVYTNALKKVAHNEEDDLTIDPLADMYKKGQLVICSICDIDKAENDFYKVTASLDPAVINDKVAVKKNIVVMATVKSVEDHGFAMDIGQPGLRAFLPKKKAKGSNPSVGQVLACLVTKVDGSAVVLASDPSRLSAAPVQDQSGITVHSLHPGMRIDARVDADIRSGVRLSFGQLRGYVNTSHRGAGDPEPRSVVRATVLYVLPLVNTVAMSLQENLHFASAIDSPQASVDDVVKAAEILEVDRSGLVVRLNDKDCGIVPRRHLNESVQKSYMSTFVAGGRATVKLLQYDPFEDRFVCTMLKHLVERSVLKIDRLSAGDLLTVKAKRFHADKGLVVEVGRSLDGFIPMLHLSDVPLKHPEKKFSPGDALKCRVLAVDPARRRLHLTHKKVLVEASYDIVDSFAAEHTGKVTEGVAIQITKDGLLLQLFGEATGWVPKSRISTEPVEYPEKLFFIGQVLKCAVVDVQTEARRMTLSLVLNDPKMKPLGTKERIRSESIKLFQACADVVVRDKSCDGLEVLVDGAIRAFVPKNHLTDHTALADQLLQTYTVGDVVERAACFEKDVLPILTLKPFLVEHLLASDKLSFDDLHEGLTMPTVVSATKSYGVFVKLPVFKFRKNALVPTRHLADVFVDNPGECVQPHQTLFSSVVEVATADKKVTMTSKPSVVHDGFDHTVRMMESFVADLDRIRKRHPEESALRNINVGDAVNCVVQEVTDFGLDASVDGVRAIVPMSSLRDVDMPEKGQTVAGVVVYVDYQHECLELTVQPDLVLRASLAKAKRQAPRIGQVVRATCVLKRSELQLATFSVKLPAQCAGHMVHVPTRHHINDQVGFGNLYGLYEEYALTVKSNPCGSLVGILEKHEKNFATRKRARINSLSGKAGPPSKKTAPAPADPPAVQSEDDHVREEGVKMESADPGWATDYDPFNASVDDVEVKSEPETVAKADGSGKTKTHLSKKEKKALDRMEAEEIQRAEKRVVEGTDAPPDCVDEFDRLVLSSPDSSLCWIQYIAFHLQRQDYDSARRVVKRALEKINFREEAERFNVYMAWFNLENSFGTEEAADEVAKEAVRCNDEFKACKALAAAYMQRDGTMPKAEKLYKTLARKFNKETDVWTDLGLFYYKANNVKEARFTMQRALQNLKKTAEIVGVTSKFAMMEFQHGEVERGKTIFESIVRDFPTRTDQWCAYVDQVIKKGQMEAARDIFERMVSLALPPKRMKSLFKKYCEFEQGLGDQHMVDAVRRKALEYLEQNDIKVGDLDPMEQMEVC